MRPLHTKWSLRYDNIQRGTATNDNWKEAVKEICVVDNVESLLYTLENTGEAEEWPFNSNFHVFREGIEPAWEDERNVNGGKWVLEIPKEDSISDERINDLWKRTIAFCVSEQVENEQICGCVFSPRKFVDRISIWTSNKNDDVINIGKAWKTLVGFENEITFKLHENALKGVRDRKINHYSL